MSENPDAKTAERRSVSVEIHTKRYGSNQSPSIQMIDVPLVNSSAVRLDITVDLRKTESIVIRPVRRDMDDTAGLIEDAQRLVNE